LFLFLTCFFVIGFFIQAFPGLSPLVGHLLNAFQGSKTKTHLLAVNLRAFSANKLINWLQAMFWLVENQSKKLKQKQNTPLGRFLGIGYVI